MMLHMHKFIIFAMAYTVELITSAVIKEQSLSLMSRKLPVLCYPLTRPFSTAVRHCTIIRVVIETWTAHWQERG